MRSPTLPSQEQKPTYTKYSIDPSLSVDVRRVIACTLYAVLILLLRVAAARYIVSDACDGTTLGVCVHKLEWELFGEHSACCFCSHGS